MSESFPETPDDTPDRIGAALVEFTGCIGGAFDDVCTYSLIHGEDYVPFAPDEEDEESCEDEECSQVWVRVTGIAPRAQEGWEGDCSVTMRLDLEVGIIRCFEVIEKGEAPTATAMLAYALKGMEDMRTIMCTALGCDVWDAIYLGQWSPMGPLGGEYGGTWTMTVELV